MTWTHEGKPIGPKPRPWRLTRAHRVEMEAALAHVRRWTLDDDDERDRLILAIFGLAHEQTRALFSSVHHQIITARVAIALRAALRADEDARCEEADTAAMALWKGHPAARVAGLAVADTHTALREWPFCRVDLPRPIARALWERT